MWYLCFLIKLFLIILRRGVETVRKGPEAVSVTGDTSKMLRQLTKLPLTADAVYLQQGGPRDYRSSMRLKTQHEERPVWVCDDGFLLLEQFRSSSKAGNDFLLTIAEPICKSCFIHEFQVRTFERHMIMMMMMMSMIIILVMMFVMIMMRWWWWWWCYWWF